MLVFVDPFDALVEDGRFEIKDLDAMDIPMSQSDTHPLRQSRHIGLHEGLHNSMVLDDRRWDFEIFLKIRTSLPIRFLPPITNTTQLKI
jgi:hypothetical protein